MGEGEKAPKANLLIVDDEPGSLLSLKELLSTPGCNVVTARSGEEALIQLLSDDFALILLDIRMPKIGRASCRERVYVLV